MKHLFAFTIVLLMAVAVQAQVDSTIANADSAVPARSTFTIGLSYANNANYYGQKSAERMPYVAAVASYRHKSGLYLNGLSYRLFDDTAHVVSAFGVGGGFAFAISKRFDMDLGYNYTFYPTLSPFLQAANPHAANATITYKNWINTTLGVDYSFGKTNDYFATLGISKEIKLFNITDKDLVSFAPSFEVTAGTQRFYSYYVEEKKVRDSLLGLPIPPFLGGSNGGTTTTTTTMKEVTNIDLLSYNLKMPVSYSRASYLLGLACQLSVLGNKLNQTQVN